MIQLLARSGAGGGEWWVVNIVVGCRWTVDNTALLGAPLTNIPILDTYLFNSQINSRVPKFDIRVKIIQIQSKVI